MVAPNSGTNVQIQSYKHSGQLHRMWKSSLVLKGTETVVIGANDRTEVREHDGRTWVTREPAICYFHAEHWFNVIGMLRTDGIHYYCNMSSPFIYEDCAIKYIDYDLDVKVNPDMTYDLLDEDEYDQHRRKMQYPSKLDYILHHQLNILLGWIRQKHGPFSPGFVDEWYERYLTYR
ncbi:MULTISPECIES: DUF402 domain-containing protein [Clostridia]|uniref:nucleoside tri-diphosphate phosphatase n=1 Tax=Clostridia TaxID=186801 RepID=UPI000EA2D045|nr:MULTISPECIES: DUF402 domain-containing protein [Clostridia]NBJ71425.1 DUF402 domain-containing protein [Roseburia sp. 1XD42-34]RKI74565.1 DUF402 domain-containing protein [Clostridium sp. 1xD42-85]